MAEVGEYFILNNVQIENCNISEMKFLVKEIWNFSFKHVKISSGKVLKVYVNGLTITKLGIITEEFTRKLFEFKNIVHKD